MAMAATKMFKVAKNSMLLKNKEIVKVTRHDMGIAVTCIVMVTKKKNHAMVS